MKNGVAEERINGCFEELKVVKEEIDKNILARSNKFLIQYAIVFASASIEVAVKTIIADQVEIGANLYAKNYIDKAIRNNSMNPSYSKIQQLMNEINPKWTELMKSEINKHPNKDRITTSINNIVKNRNNIAHGRGCSASINNVMDWVNDSVELIKIIDLIAS